MDRSPDALSRRQFVQGAGLAGLSLLAGCGRLPWPDPQAARVARIGWLGPSQASDSNFEVFREGLRELGWVEGQNCVVETRWAEARFEQSPALAAELVRLQPDVIVSRSGPLTQAAVQATSTIPIIFVNVGDPVGGGLVASLARPGGNVTGLSGLFVDLSGKRLELLRETVPSAYRVAALWNPSNPLSARDRSAMQEAARTLGVEMRSVEVRNADELSGAFESIARDCPDALILLADPLFSVTGGTPQLLNFVAGSRLPTMHLQRADVEAGGLMSYGASLAAMSRRAAYYVDRILKGTSPADLPVEQPREFELIINLRTAQTLGLTIPQHVLAQATEVIQ
jgi:putative tryptophan/tyrosine transport system substrate-binding protein